MKNQILALITLIALSGCMSNQAALDNYDQTARLDKNLVANYKEANSPREEYVNRVAKRVALVSDRPDTNYNILILDTAEPKIELDHENKTVMISDGVLANLHDEAQLAAALAMGMARLENSSNIDRETATYLSRAGYDPNAMLDLQQQYFYAAQRGQSHWLQSVYSAPPSPGTITANQVMVQKMPKGLMRDTESFKKNINAQQ